MIGETLARHPPSLTLTKTITAACVVILTALPALAMQGLLPAKEGPMEDPKGAGFGESGVGSQDSQMTNEVLIVGTLDLNPDVFNLRSGGKYVTGYLELPDGYPVREVFVPSVKLNDAVYAETCFGIQIFDTDSDGKRELMLKFSKEDFKAVLEPGIAVHVWVTGMMNDGSRFTAGDVICVRAA